MLAQRVKSYASCLPISPFKGAKRPFSSLDIEMPVARSSSLLSHLYSHSFESGHFLPEPNFVQFTEIGKYFLKCWPAASGINVHFSRELVIWEPFIYACFLTYDATPRSKKGILAMAIEGRKLSRLLSICEI